MSSDADRVLALTRSRPPTLGAGRVVCLDGPAGSGKTTLAATIADRGGASVVHLDDLYDGWEGLATIVGALQGLLGPLAENRPGRYRRYDWHRGGFAETVEVPPADLLVLEGVGSGCRAVADLVTVLVWVEAPYDVRRRRALERDGDTFAPYWDAWAESERVHFATEGTRDRADLHVTTG